MCLERQRRVELEATVEQIEYLSDDQCIHRCGAGQWVGGVDRFHPEKGPQRQREQPQADEDDAPYAEAIQDATLGCAWRSLHDIQFVRFERDYQPERNRGHHVDPENLRRCDRRNKTDHDGRQDDKRLGGVGRQHEQHRLFNIVVGRAPFLDGRRDRGEVVVGEHHLRRFLGDFGALDPHGNPDVGFLQRWRIVNPVARHRHDLPVRLDCLHQPQFVFGAGTGKDIHIADTFLQGGSVHFLDLGTRDRRLAVADAQHLGDCRCGDAVIAGNHRHPDAACMTLFDGFDCLLAWRVKQPDQADENEVFRQVFRAERTCGDIRDFKPGHSQNAFAL